MELGERKMAGGFIGSMYTGTIIKTGKAQEVVLENKLIFLDTLVFLYLLCGIYQMWMYLNSYKREFFSQHKTFNHYDFTALLSATTHSSPCCVEIGRSSCIC